LGTGKRGNTTSSTKKGSRIREAISKNQFGEGVGKRKRRELKKDMHEEAL